MSTDLQELYQQVILDHQRAPRNFRDMPTADRTCEGRNPLCGDEVTVYLQLEGDRVVDASFQGVGCAICVSSASMMTERIKGKAISEIETLFGSFHALLTESGDDKENIELLDKLRVFAGVRRFPVRVKCAMLPWHALITTIEGGGETVSTE